MDDVTTIGTLEEALRIAMLANDVDALTDLLDDDLVFTGPDGKVFSKSDDLSVHRLGLLHLDRLDLYDSRIHPIGELFLTTAKATLAGRFVSTPFEGAFAYTRLWRRNGTFWRVVAGHAGSID